MSKPILCLDFDGVLHSYTSGWMGATVIFDPPVPGAIAFIRAALEYFDVQIYSSRSSQPGGIAAMKLWLAVNSNNDEELITQVGFPDSKPSAFVTLDDRAITFEGSWPNLEVLRKFKPWNKR